MSFLFVYLVPDKQFRVFQSFSVDCVLTKLSFEGRFKAFRNPRSCRRGPTLGLVEFTQNIPLLPEKMTKRGGDLIAFECSLVHHILRHGTWYRITSMESSFLRRKSSAHQYPSKQGETIRLHESMWPEIWLFYIPPPPQNIHFLGMTPSNILVWIRCLRITCLAFIYYNSEWGAGLTIQKIGHGWADPGRGLNEACLIQIPEGNGSQQWRYQILRQHSGAQSMKEASLP